MRHTGAKTPFLEGVTDFGFIISKEGLAGVWKVQEKERVLDASVTGKGEDKPPVASERVLGINPRISPSTYTNTSKQS